VEPVMPRAKSNQPIHQPLIQYIVRESWDTGYEDYEVDSITAATRKKDELAKKLAKKLDIHFAAALPFISIHVMVRTGL
jgi:hypothetical protein